MKMNMNKAIIEENIEEIRFQKALAKAKTYAYALMAQALIRNQQRRDTILSWEK